MSSFTNLSVYSRPNINANRAFTKISALESVYENIRLQAVYVWTGVNGKKNIFILKIYSLQFYAYTCGRDITVMANIIPASRIV